MCVVLLLAFIPCLLTLFRFEAKYSEEEQEITEKRIQEIVYGISAHQTAVMESARGLLSALALMDDIRKGDHERTRKLFAAVLRENPLLEDILLTDRLGRVIASGRSLIEGQDLNSLPGMRETMTSRQFFVSRHVRGSISELAAMDCFYPIVDHAGLHGVLIGVINIGASIQTLNILDFLPKASLVIADPSGQIIFSLSKSSIYTNVATLPEEEQEIILAAEQDLQAVSHLDKGGGTIAFSLLSNYGLTSAINGFSPIS
jgi:hypothetical protein